jgi:hypothetical protein
MFYEIHTNSLVQTAQNHHQGLGNGCKNNGPSVRKVQIFSVGLKAWQLRNEFGVSITGWYNHQIG